MTPRPHTAPVPMPVQAQRMAEARARFYRATPLYDIVEEPLIVPRQEAEV